nr:putative zinc finger, CCHC-type [Tanacetum cinerariifolium]
MSLMIIKNSISVAIRDAIPDFENANEYLSSVEEQLKGLQRLMQEERLKVEKPDVIHVTTTNSNKRKGSWKGKGSSGDNSTPNKVQKTGTSTSSFQGGPKCKFCHKKWHTQKDCLKFKEWLAKKERNQRTVKVGNGVHLNVEAYWDPFINIGGGGEYYGRHTDVGQAPGSFFDFCKDHEIINQYTMSGTPQQNGVAERRNYTLMDMEENPAYDICGQSQKLDLKTISFFFIGYPERSKGYRFYCPSHSTRIVETRHAKFLENANNSGRGKCNDPESFEDAITCDKSAYWREAMEDELSSISKNNVDQCVYLKMSGSNFIIHVLYVDDILSASNNIDLLHESKRFLSRNFDMKDLGEASYVIGLEIHRDRANGILGLSQNAYIERILNIQHCSPTVAPVIKGDVFRSHQCLKTKVVYEEMRFQSNPGLLHWKAAKKVLRYLQGTKEYELTYTRSDNLEVIGYSKSDFAKCKDTSRSTSGYIFKLSGWPISWKSHKQVLTTTSTTMVEYVSVYNATCHAIASVSFTNSNSSTGVGLYLDTKYLFVRERVEEQRISIEHIRTHEMLTDPLTKGLPPKVFQGHVAKMALRQDIR